MKRHFNIDIVGHCNLRCPSCPVGNFKEVRQPKGLMSLETFKRIIEKAQRESDVAGINLYNWAEPLLHPQVADFIRVVNAAGLRCNLSTNLNNIKNLEAAIAANPYHLRISISGYNHSTYGTTHQGGKIGVVLSNMLDLAEFKNKHQASTRIVIMFHRYKTNLDDEADLRAVAAELGFEFDAVWAYMMPVEKVLACVDGNHDGLLTREDSQFIAEKLTLPPAQTIYDVCRSERALPCRIAEDMTIDVNGDVQVCCASFDTRSNVIGNYLAMPEADIQAAKYKHDLCARCVSHGAHVLMNYASPKLNRVALANVPDAAQRRRLTKAVRKQQVRRAAEWVYHTFLIDRVLKPAVLAKWVN